MWLALAGLLTAKDIRRRRQRRQSDPGRRVAGAWEHMLDRMVERAITLPPSLTTDEVAARAAGHLGPAASAPLRALVGVVDAARYDRRFPPSPNTANEAWARAAEFELDLRRHSPPLKRLRARLSPAPLRRVTPPRRKSRSGAQA